MNAWSHRTLYLWVLTIACSVAPSLRAQQTVVNQDPAFTLQLPEGFVPRTELASAGPRILHGFCLGDFDDDEPDILLFLEKLGGVIGREQLRQEDMPPGFTGRLFHTKWHDFEVEAFEVPEQMDGFDVLTYNIQIPLKRNAIQVKLFGPADRRAELETLIPQILGGLEGETNWISSGLDGLPFANSPSYRYVLLGLGITIVIGGLVGLLLLSRRTPKGTVLVAAIIIWSVGASFAGVREREMLMIGGSLKMLGFAGFILGIVDLVRKRKDVLPAGGSPELEVVKTGSDG